MADTKDRVLREVGALLDAGKSLVITAMSDSTNYQFEETLEESKLLSTEGRRCIQWVILPDGTRICVEYSAE